MRTGCESEEAHEWELVRWRCGLGGTLQRPVLRCTRCAAMRPATEGERAWMELDAHGGEAEAPPSSEPRVPHRFQVTGSLLGLFDRS